MSIRIDIVVDTVCPWCYVGKRRLERALSMRSLPKVEIGWRPFQLNPHMPRQGMEWREYIDRKFGASERAQTQYRALKEAGGEEGLHFRFADIRRAPNSLDSHRLIRFAGEYGLQTEMVEALFRGYFLEARDIGDYEVLANIASELGLERDVALKYLVSGRDGDVVLAEDRLARNMGINGVPCYIVNREYALSGAQPPEVFLQVLDLALQELTDVAAE